MPYIPHHTHKYTLTHSHHTIPHMLTHTPHTRAFMPHHTYTYITPCTPLGTSAQRLGRTALVLGFGDCPPARSSPCKAFLCPVGSRVLGLGLCINKGWGWQLGLAHPHPGTCPEAPSGSPPPVPQTQTPSTVGLRVMVSQSLQGPTPFSAPSPLTLPTALEVGSSTHQIPMFGNSWLGLIKPHSAGSTWQGINNNNKIANI